MPRQARKRKPHHNGQHAQHRTRRYVRDLDQIHDDLKTRANVHRLEHEQALDTDLPGLGQFYCVECAKYCDSETALLTHRRSKPHKKRLKVLQEVPYTQEEADAAAGMLVKPRDFSKEAATSPDAIETEPMA